MCIKNGVVFRLNGSALPDCPVAVPASSRHTAALQHETRYIVSRFMMRLTGHQFIIEWRTNNGGNEIQKISLNFF